MLDSCAVLTPLVVVITISSCRTLQAAVATVTAPTTDADCPSTCPHGVPSRCLGQAMRHVGDDAMNDAQWFCGIVEIIPKGLMKLGWCCNGVYI